REIRCILGANFSEWAALRFGIRPFPAHIADHLARSPINQCFPSHYKNSFDYRHFVKRASHHP
ncbi:hypothetical protein, partial [Burkholderia sp. BCC1630]|uniref:hypothetical protein n=1 Tax=Burkholderia sp. BCC1630 TaxID=2676304 RepID=UPI001ABA9B59